MSRSLWLCNVVLGALLLSGCATMIEVRAVQPPLINVGGAKKFEIVQIEGVEKGREVLLAGLAKRAAEEGSFTVIDRHSDGITLAISGNTLQINGLKKPLEADEVLLHVEVLDWSFTKKENPEVASNESRASGSTDPRNVFEAKTRVKITLTNGRGIVVVKEYGGTHTNDENEQSAMETQANATVDAIVEDYAPHKVTSTVRLDNDDAGEKENLDRAKAGDLPKAIEGLRAYLAKNAGNVIAQYNLAVLLDASGGFQEALDLFTKAAAAPSKKDYYVEAKDECAKRAAAVKEIKAQQVEVPAPAPAPAPAK